MRRLSRRRGQAAARCEPAPATGRPSPSGGETKVTVSRARSRSGTERENTEPQDRDMSGLPLNQPTGQPPKRATVSVPRSRARHLRTGRPKRTARRLFSSSVPKPLSSANLVTPAICHAGVSEEGRSCIDGHQHVETMTHVIGVTAHPSLKRSHLRAPKFHENTTHTLAAFETR